MDALPHEIRRMTIDPVNFTPVSSSRDCNKVVLSRGSEDDSFAVRSDRDDAQTERTVAAGSEYPIVANPGSPATALEKGKTLCWVRATSLAGTLIVESTR